LKLTKPTEQSEKLNAILRWCIGRVKISFKTKLQNGTSTMFHNRKICRQAIDLDKTWMSIAYAQAVSPQRSKKVVCPQRDVSMGTKWRTRANGE